MEEIIPTVSLKLKEAYICPEPDCELIRKGPGPCACGISQTVPLANTYAHKKKRDGELVDLMQAAGRVMLKSRLSPQGRRLVSGNFECDPALQGACKERLNCLDGGPVTPCPMGCGPKEAA
jgi:hypothetical protein